MSLCSAENNTSVNKQRIISVCINGPRYGDVLGRVRVRVFGLVLVLVRVGLGFGLGLGFGGDGARERRGGGGTWNA